MAYHQRTAVIILALGLAAGVPAAAAAQQPANPSSSASASPCSEVCSGGGYGLLSQPSRTPDNSSAYRAARIPPTAGRVVTASDGFHWADAGLGAGGMLALSVIGLGGALTLTHRRNQRIHG